MMSLLEKPIVSELIKFSAYYRTRISVAILTRDHWSPLYCFVKCLIMRFRPQECSGHQNRHKAASIGLRVFASESSIETFKVLPDSPVIYFWLSSVRISAMICGFQFVTESVSQELPADEDLSNSDYVCFILSSQCKCTVTFCIQIRLSTFTNSSRSVVVVVLAAL
jgi:hypothetical protein